MPLSSGLSSDDCASTVISMVSESESAKVAAKQTMGAFHPSLFIASCFAHQINLVTGFLVNHPSLRSSAAKMKKVVSFFLASEKRMGHLEECMDVSKGKRLSMVKRGETQWYSHYGMVRRLLEIMEALVSFRI